MSMYLKTTSATVTGAGNTPAGAYSVSLMNTGASDVLVAGVPLAPGGVVEYGSYGVAIGPVSYDAQGGSIRVDIEFPAGTYNKDTVESIIKTAATAALRIDENHIQRDVVQYAIDSYNIRGRLIWDSWKWDQTKMQEIVIVPDADGIATLPVEVDAVRAVYAGTTRNKSNAVRPYNEEQRVYGSAGQLTPVGFEYLSDDYLGCRRIRFAGEQPGGEYTILALRRFQEAVIDPNYSPEAPLETPTDYRVQRWLIDRAKPALTLFIEDRLRDLAGQAQSGEGSVALQVAVKREEMGQIRDNRVTPAYPMFSGRRR